MLAKYPNGKDGESYPEEEAQMNMVMDIIRTIRNIRAEMKVPMGKKAEVIIAADQQQTARIKEAESYILALAQASAITFSDKGFTPDKAAKGHVMGADIFLPLAGLIDLDTEIARIKKEIAATEGELKRLAGKLGNENFIAKAPAEVVEKEKAKQGVYEEKLESLKQHLALLS